VFLLLRHYRREAEPVLIDQGMARNPIGVGGTVEIDLCDVGIAVVDRDGRVSSSNARARELLRAESQSELDDRLGHVLRRLLDANHDGFEGEASIDVPGLGAIAVRSCDVAGTIDGRVLLFRDARSLPGTAGLLQQAARQRSFSFLSRDWAHDLKGMLHVIRINTALLARLFQRDGITDVAVTRCLDAIPREVERLDKAIESMFGARTADQHATFDVGTTCERLRSLVAARAARQRVEVVVELPGGPREIVGHEDQVQSALLNVIVNALEAMPDQGRLVISADGDAGSVTVRISDSGTGMQPQPNGRGWHPHFVNDRRQIGIGLHVTRAIVESHGGHIETVSNVPNGTCIEITFPSAAAIGRLGHGSRTHR
jgi:signal transduction histidine kinase